jgi:hypothetical protein
MKRRMGISPKKNVGSQPKLEDILSLTTDTGCAIGILSLSDNMHMVESGVSKNHDYDSVLDSCVS